MKRLTIFAIAVLSLSTITTAFGQSLKGLLADAGKQAVVGLINQQGSREATKHQRNRIQDVLDQSNQDLNRDVTPFRLPAKTAVSVEIDVNETGVPTAQLIAIAKNSLQNWWDGLLPAANFDDRNRVKEINETDRKNEELRDPIGKHQMVNRRYDVHITATRHSATNFASGDLFEQILSRLLGGAGGYSSFDQSGLVQLTIEFRDAAEQVSPLTIHVIGADVKGYSVSFDVQTRALTVSYRRSSYTDTDSPELVNAFAQARAIACGVTPKSKHR